MCDFILIVESSFVPLNIFTQCMNSTAETQFLLLEKRIEKSILSGGLTIFTGSVGSFAPERWRKVIISRWGHKVSKVSKYRMSTWILGKCTKWCMTFSVWWNGSAIKTCNLVFKCIVFNSVKISYGDVWGVFTRIQCGDINIPLKLH